MNHLPVCLFYFGVSGFITFACAAVLVSIEHGIQVSSVVRFLSCNGLKFSFRQITISIFNTFYPRGTYTLLILDALVHRPAVESISRRALLMLPLPCSRSRAICERAGPEYTRTWNSWTGTPSGCSVFVKTSAELVLSFSAILLALDFWHLPKGANQNERPWRPLSAINKIKTVTFRNQ